MRTRIVKCNHLAVVWTSVHVSGNLIDVFIRCLLTEWFCKLWLRRGGIHRKVLNITLTRMYGAHNEILSGFASGNCLRSDPVV